MDFSIFQSQSHYGFNSIGSNRSKRTVLPVSIPLWIQFNSEEGFWLQTAIRCLNPTMDSIQWWGTELKVSRNEEVSIPLWIQFNRSQTPTM